MDSVSAMNLPAMKMALDRLGFPAVVTVKQVEQVADAELRDWLQDPASDIQTAFGSSGYQRIGNSERPDLLWLIDGHPQALFRRRNLPRSRVVEAVNRLTAVTSRLDACIPKETAQTRNNQVRPHGSMADSSITTIILGSLFILMFKPPAGLILLTVIVFLSIRFVRPVLRNLYNKLFH